MIATTMENFAFYKKEKGKVSVLHRRYELYDSIDAEGSVLSRNKHYLKNSLNELFLKKN